MNKILIYIFTALLMVSCEDTEKCSERIDEHSVSENIQELDSSACSAWPTHYKVYSLDGCEYIVVGFGHNRWGSHKGNCSNSIHKGQHPSPHQLDIVEEDSDQQDYSLFEKEKHFDCYVTEIIPEDEGNSYVYTECGIAFITDKKYKVGQKLKGFKSPKHK